MQHGNERISKTRGIYFLRLIGRVSVFLIAILIYIFDKEKYNITDGWNFFNELSPLHLLWIIWMWDMVLQFIPVKAHISIGSQKVFESLFRPIKEKINYKNLKQYIKDTTASAYKVMVIWIALTIALSILHVNGVIDTDMMILTATFFYVKQKLFLII